MQQITIDIDPEELPVKRKLRPIQVVINRQNKTASFLMEAADLNSNGDQIGEFNQHGGQYDCSIVLNPQDPEDAAGIAWLQSKMLAAIAASQTPVE